MSEAEIDYKLVIFDCDGVLVDSETVGLRMLAQMVNEYGLYISAEEAKIKFRGRKIADCVSEIESQLGRRLPDNFIKVFRSRSYETFRQELRPCKNVKFVLDHLDIPVCVASSAPLEKIELTLGITKLRDYFGERIYSAYELGAWKPDPTLFLHAASEMKTSPEDCVVIEDSTVGVQAGIAAGMRVFGYADDSARADSLRDKGATVFSEMINLLPLLGIKGLST